MKKFELRNLIKEIVQRKLNENIGQTDDGASVNKIVRDNSIKDVKIMTHAGSHNLEIVAIYENNGVLCFNVNAYPFEQNETIQEIGEVGATGITAPVSGMKASDVRSLETYQRDLDRLAISINKIDVEKANLVKKQGEILKKIRAIKDKQ